MTKQKIYGLCGVLWFAMDIAWYWHFHYIALIIGSLTLMSCVCGMFIHIRSKKDIHIFYIVLATFSWIMLNICSLLRDMYVDLILYLNYFAFMFSLLGVLCLIAVGSNIEKFKKL
jgi:hypothetical protein